jgi:ATP-dependent protease ClpP protease subunit
MPFGPNCEYQDQAACERANHDRDDPAAYCAAVRRRTEAHCMNDRTGMAKRAMPLAADSFDGRPRPRIARPVARANARWYRITNKAIDITLIDIYDEIGWFGISAQDFVKDLREITTPKIELHISSPGGDVFDAIAIYNGLRQHDAQVHVIIDSLAASAASFIAMAGDKITATANSMMMIHDALGLVIGNAADMRDMAGLLDKHSDNIASIYAARAGGDTQTWRDRMAEEVWYNAEEAYKAGLVDEVQGDGQPVTDVWDLSIFQHAPDGQQATPAIPAAAAAEVIVDTACPTHHTATVDGTWDAGPNEKRLPSPMSTATAKKAYGYYDSGRVEAGQVVKAACKLLHHEVGGDGTPGAAHLAGVRNALSRLPQSSIPEAEHSAIEAHLHAHMNDAPQDSSTTSTSSTTSNGSNSGRSRHLGDTATWYLPGPEGKEQNQWMR